MTLGTRQVTYLIHHARFLPKTRLKPDSSATETSSKTGISIAASLDMILSKMGITKALIRMHGCTGWSASLLFASP